MNENTYTIEDFQNDEEKVFWKAVYLACISQNNVGDEISLECADSAVQSLRKRKGVIKS